MEWLFEPRGEDKYLLSNVHCPYELKKEMVDMLVSIGYSPYKEVKIEDELGSQVMLQDKK